MNRILDNVYVFRILKTLTTKWQDLPAFKTGVININGDLVVKPNKQTEVQRNSYTKLDVLVFKLKKLLEKLPLGKTTIARYAAALWLIKEEIDDRQGLVEAAFTKYLHENDMSLEYMDMLKEDMGTANVSGGVDITDKPLMTNVVKRKPFKEFVKDKKALKKNGKK